MSNYKKPGWIGVDLDGTLAMHVDLRQQPPNIIGAPILPIVERVRQLLADGKIVKVMTARCSSSNSQFGRALFAKAWHDWSHALFGQVLELTAEKELQMHELWDDRARQVRRDTGVFVDEVLTESLQENLRLQEKVSMLEAVIEMRKEQQ